MVTITKKVAVLLSAVSVIALSTHAQAADYIFGGNGPVTAGERVSVKGQTTQIKLDNGAIISFIGTADFTVQGNEVIVHSGNITVLAAKDAPVKLIVPAPSDSGLAQSEVTLTGAGSVTINSAGINGHIFSGGATLLTARGRASYTAGEAWEAPLGSAPRQIFAARTQAAPGSVLNQAQGGIAAAALNGFPVALGDALAAIGAQGDVISSALRLKALGDNPGLVALPSGDVELLLSYSAQLAAALGGGASFNGANPAIITAYLNYLAAGGQISEFQTAYTGILLQYLQLLQSGAPSGNFGLLDLPSLNAYIAYLQNTGALQQAVGSQSDLVRAYLAFLANGGTPVNFIAPANLLSPDVLAAYVQLITNYSAFLSNGGNPADFMGATPEIILQYLAALESAGILNAQLGDQASVLRDYLNFVLGGGNPADFSGFRLSEAVAAQYALAIQQFVDFVLAGGIPSSFTGLDAITFQAYLEALIADDYLATLLADQVDFLNNYLAFLQGGGAFDDFGGLPDPVSDVEKLAQLDAFLAFIAAGGVPSEFDGATAAILAAYFEDLGSIFASQTRLENRAFLNAYFRYVENGNAADLFPVLPSNGGRVISGQTAYSFANGNEFVNSFGVTGRAILLDGDNRPYEGVPTNTSSIAVSPTVSVAEYTALGDVSVSRLTGGTFTEGGQSFTLGDNQGVHYATVPQISNLPTNAVFRYELAAATSPTFADGGTAPGVFNADIAIAYSGSEIRLATEGSVMMPTDATYTFATAGGLDGVLGLDPTTFVGANGIVFIQQGAITLTGTGRACLADAACTLYMTALPGGDGANALAVSYESRSGGEGSVPFHGAAAFISAGIFTPGGGGSGVFGTERTNQITAFTGPISGIDTRQPTTVIYADGSGAPLSYLWTLNDFTLERENPNIGTAQENESGSVGDIIGWTRWAGGTTAGTYYNSGGTELGPNSGEHFISGTPATNLPTSGTVQYALIGATNPTIRDGSLAPGTFTGDLAVAFGAQPHVGFEFDVAIGGHSYAINTPGGIADPMQGVEINVSGDERFNMTFGAQLAVIGTGPVCVGSRPCMANVQGFLAGAGGSHAGVTYTFGSGNGSGPGYVGGVAAFGARQ